ncbi:MAG: PilZ domain-containing protein [Desulfobacterales bacterium]
MALQNGIENDISQIKLIEKRNDYRYRYLAEIIYGSDQKIGKGLVRDLSVGGVFVAADRKVPVGSEILVTLPFAKSVRYVSLRGTVVRMTGDGFAVAFRK